MKKIKSLIVLGVLAVLLVTGCQSKVAEVTNDGDGISEQNPVSGVMLNEVEAETLDGEVLTGEVFAKSKVTVVNLWGTFCGPCVEEMPDLEKISQAYKTSEVQVIGIVTDPESKDEAVEIVNKLNVTYKNILANDQLNELIVSKFEYVPATLFIDSQGKVLETFIPGGASEEQFKSVIDGL